MKIQNKETLAFLGDIHGQFRRIGYLARQKNITDAVIVQVGDFGIGYYKPNYYKTELSRVNDVLKERNIVLVAIRGNHDNPEYFKETHKPFDLENIWLLKDYEELTVCNKQILLVGGAQSIDRVDNVEGETYWRDEVINVKTPDEFDYKKYDIVVTHTALGMPYEEYKSSVLKYFLEKDKDLANDIKREQEQITNLYKYTTPRFWYHGHFHHSYSRVHEQTHFKGLEIDEISEHFQYN